MALVLLLVGIALSYSLYRAGGVIPADYYRVAAALALIVPVSLAVVRSAPKAPSLPKTILWPAIALPLYLAFQIVPLPIGLVSLVSPARAEIHQSLALVTQPRSWAPLSVVPAVTLLHLVQTVSCLVALWLIWKCVWSFRQRPWIVAAPLVIIGVWEAAIGLLQPNSNPDRLPGGTFVNHNHFAGLLEMVFPFAALLPVALLSRTQELHQVSSRPAGFWRVAAACASIGAAGTILAASLHSLSRVGLIAMLAGGGICGAGMALSGVWLQRFSVAARWSFAGGVALATLLLGFLFLPPAAFVSRFSKSDMRAEIWTESMPLVREYWLFGCGSGGYESVFMRYKRTAPMFRVDYAHNDYLQRWIELGAVGFSIAAALMAAILWQVWRAAGSSSGVRALKVASISAIVAILLHSFFDFNLYIPANALVFAWICGIAAALPLLSHPAPKVYPRAPRTV